ncbi:MAG: hypothetical protein AB7J35_13895 [Dehalococcoidia bacterium]
MKSPTATTRRGFRRERHSRFKAVIAAIAAAGFLGGWVAFASAHPALQPCQAEATLASPTVQPTTTAATAPPTSAVRTATPIPGSVATPTTAAAPPEPDAAVTRTPRRSRGS